MEEKNFDAKLAKLSHDIEQLNAKMENEISSLREGMRKEILRVTFHHIRDISLFHISFKPVSPQVYKRVWDEIMRLCRECHKAFDKISADELEEELSRLQEDINRVTRAAGLGEVWHTPKDDQERT